MSLNKIKIIWPNGNCSFEEPNSFWLDAAKKAGISIPTGCLTGSCGACEIDVNGKTVRACIGRIKTSKEKELSVEMSTDPYW